MAARRCRSSARTRTSGSESRSTQHEIVRFRQRVDETGLTPVVSHASYLINLATSVPQLRQQSIAAFVDELDRAESLGLRGVVIHPGTCTAGSEEDALRLIAEAIGALSGRARARRSRSCSSTPPVRGAPSGIDSSIWPRSSAHLDGSPRVGVCLDTCHLLASGYDISRPGRLRRHLRVVRAPRRPRSPRGLPWQRLEEAMWQPSRSARAHRQRIRRARTVSAAARRSPVCRSRRS